MYEQCEGDQAEPDKTMSYGKTQNWEKETTQNSSAPTRLLCQM